MTREELMSKYPLIFRQKSLDMKQTCMCWGIECGEGWLPLIDTLCKGLQWNTDKNNFPQVEATQVKEKYGTLRFYYISFWPSDCKKTDDEESQESYKHEHINGMISFAEQISGIICETCGTTKDTFQTEGWVRTTCEKCDHARRAERAEQNRKGPLQ